MNFTITIGCILHLMHQLPQDKVPYRNCYIFCDNDETLYFISKDGKKEKVPLNDVNLFKESLTRVKAGKDTEYFYLNEAEAYELITLNGGHSIMKPPEESATNFGKFVQKFNLEIIVNFHDCVRELLKQEYQGIKDDSIESKLDKAWIENYNNYLTANTFLMMYSHVEEWLFIHTNSDTDHGSGLKRFERSLITKGLNTSSSEWQNLLKAEKIRNCLLHANGRLSFVKESDKICITQIIRQKEYFESENDRFIMKKKYLHYFKNKINKLLNQLSE